MSNIRVCFVIPTYNEALNIKSLLQRLTELYPDPDTAFLVVDDESPDGTGNLARKFAAAEEGRRVHLLEAPRNGLGKACARGIAYALDDLGAEVVVQMDADFSHDPADAAKLLEHLADGADVAIGSRYAPGGAIDNRWNPWRRLLSRWGNRFARFVAGLNGVRDCTAGFKAVKAEALRAAQIEHIWTRGHAFQVAQLHRLLHAGARIREEPIYFRDRERGRTKLGLASVVEFFYAIWWFRMVNNQIFIKYMLTGLSGALINLGTFHLMLELGLHKFIASPIAIELSIITNFLINNYWTFADRVVIGTKRIRGLKYNFISLLTLALSFFTFIVLSFLFPQASLVLLQACGIIPVAFLNYFLNSYWTFSEMSATQTQPLEEGEA